jgi:hypothetical protein
MLLRLKNEKATQRKTWDNWFRVSIIIESFKLDVDILLLE